MLWSEPAEQGVDLVDEPEVQRKLSATGTTIDHLELGAGGDYVALTTSAHFQGADLPRPNVGSPRWRSTPRSCACSMPPTGGSVQRYRSWCDGVHRGPLGDITNDWECAAVAGRPPRPLTCTSTT